jgi:hypothetical protein
VSGRFHVQKLLAKIPVPAVPEPNSHSKPKPTIIAAKMMISPENKNSELTDSS